MMPGPSSWPPTGPLLRLLLVALSASAALAQTDDHPCPPATMDDGGDCAPCPANFYCPGVAEAIPCPSDLHSPPSSFALDNCTAGVPGPDKCTDPDEGLYYYIPVKDWFSEYTSEEENQEGFCTWDCGYGYAQNDAAHTCDPCQPGTFSEAWESKCKKCPLGTAIDKPGAWKCKVCKPGTYADRRGSTTCLPCPEGEVSEEGAAKCRPNPCNPGTFFHAKREHDGWYHEYTEEEGEDSDTEESPPGKCLRKCPAGFVPPFVPFVQDPPEVKGASLSVAARVCQACPAGSTSERGDLECSLCPAGTAAREGKGKCRPCRAGKFSSKEGSKRCEYCPVNTYSEERGASECAACPEGETSGYGSTSCWAESPSTCYPETESRICVIKPDKHSPWDLNYEVQYPAESKDDCVKACTTEFTSGTGAYFFSYDVKAQTCHCLSECYHYRSDPDLEVQNGAVYMCPNVEGDPHFVGARGTHFDFNGDQNRSFCLFTDENVHLNGFFAGYRKKGHVPRTWIKDVSLQWRSSNGSVHIVQLFARRGKSEKRGAEGFLAAVTVDGKSVRPPLKVGEQVKGGGGLLLRLDSTKESVKHGLERDTYSLKIGNLLSLELALNPELRSMQAEDDSEVHFNLRFTDVKATSEVHGVLGQTFRPEISRMLRAAKYQMINRLLPEKENIVADGKSGRGFLDGSRRDYVTSSLDKANCRFAKAWNLKGRSKVAQK